VAYDKLFKMTVLKFYNSCRSRVKTAKLFEVNVSSITRWEREYAENGEIKDPAPRKSTFRKVSPDELRDYVNEHPDAYQREIAARFNRLVL
jgi:transposase